jgi:hypothetical protein
MLWRTIILLVVAGFCVSVWIGTNTGAAQTSIAEFQKNLREKAVFEESDLAEVQKGEAVVKLLPAQDKREVAVCGLVTVRVPAEVFLQSFRESMVRKSNPAILEIGRFSDTPTLDDLQALTIEDRDIEDLKECVAGECKVKLSATMIDRFRKELDWSALDYRIRATQLMKQILLDYVRDYQAHGDAALIKYNDKSTEVRLADEQRSLTGASIFFSDPPTGPQHSKDSTRSELSTLENTIVWSKIKFGLKPVFAINHITIFKNEQKTGPQILIVSKQIYANHYFDSSLALTAFISLPNSTESYLLYENRSRADGLGGPFGKIKRGIVENEAVAGLRTILEQSRVNLDARAFSQTDPTPNTNVTQRWRRWIVIGTYLLLGVFVSAALMALLRLSNNVWKNGIKRPVHE